ncbi:MAG: ABC transporter permease [Candidatus Berkelbacteria bacterium]
MNTVYILWLRQLKRYLRSRSRIIGALGQPLLFIVAFGFGFGAIFARAGAGNYMNFLIPGIIGQSILFTAISSGIDLIWDRQFGFLKETLAAPVSRFAIFFGRTLGGATVATIQGIIVLALSFIVKFQPFSLTYTLIAILAMFLISLLFTALGTAMAAKMEDFHGFQLIMNFLVMPLFFLSGALFPLDSMPKALNIIAKFNPLTYGVDLLRGLLTNIWHFNMSLDLLILAGLTAFLLLLGSFLFSQIEV